MPTEDLDLVAAMTPSERLREAASWNRVMSQLALASREARREGHPATRLSGLVSRDSEMEERPLNLSRLFEVLARHRVDYVVIGGVAAQVHGHRRTTGALDLTPDPEPGNLRRLAAALDELSAQPRDAALAGAEIPASDAERLPVAAIVPPLLTRHGQVHVLKEPKGGRAFEQLRAAALVIEIDGVEVAIASLDDLIRMKRATGRPSDLADIAALVEAARRRRG